MARPEVHFHINPRQVGNWRGKERLALFTRLAEMCEAQGLVYRAIARPGHEMQTRAGKADGNIHVVENGRMQGEGWLNAATAYLTGFWHMDPRGMQAESSAVDDVFEAGAVDADAAERFANRLKALFVLPRKSRYRQPVEVASDIPEGAVALFLQGPSAYHSGRCSLPMAEMIGVVARGSGGRPVVVKPHPQMQEGGALAILHAVEAGAEVLATEANVHDILAAAAVTVSVNSAVAFEGFLHGKPSVLFGKSDFPSLITRAFGAEDYSRALETALAKDWPFAQMLHWYFSRHSLELSAPDFEARAFAGFERVGFSKGRLGVE
jgi:hypothetical protein